MSTPTGAFADIPFYRRPVSEASLYAPFCGEENLFMSMKPLRRQSLFQDIEQKTCSTCFAQAGTVESASVIEDRETGRSRGFGFVEMATKERAKRQSHVSTARTWADAISLSTKRARAKSAAGGGRGGYGGAGNRGRRRAVTVAIVAAGRRGRRGGGYGGGGGGGGGDREPRAGRWARAHASEFALKRDAPGERFRAGVCPSIATIFCCRWRPFSSD